MLIMLISAALPLIALALLILFVSRNIVRVPPNELAVISGRRRVLRDPATGVEQVVGHRTLSGGSAFIIPFIERIDHLPLNEMSIEVEVDGQPDSAGIVRHASLLVNCHISGEPPLVEQAIVRFLGMELSDIEQIVRNTIESRLVDALLGSEVGENGMGWSALEARLIAAIRADLGALGLVVDNIVFRGPPRSGDPASMEQDASGLRLDN